MKLVNVYDAKTHLSKLIESVLQGQEIVIAKHGHPVVRLVPHEQIALSKRKGGQLRGMMSVSDDFDAPLPSDVLQLFTGGKK